MHNRSWNEVSRRSKYICSLSLWGWWILSVGVDSLLLVTISELRIYFTHFRRKASAFLCDETLWWYWERRMGCRCILSINIINFSPLTRTGLKRAFATLVWPWDVKTFKWSGMTKWLIHLADVLRVGAGICTIEYSTYLQLIQSMYLRRGSVQLPNFHPRVVDIPKVICMSIRPIYTRI